MTSIERLGMERGSQERKAEGKLEGKRTALRLVLQARFQTIPEELEERIAATDEGPLDQLLQRTAMVQNADEL